MMIVNFRLVNEDTKLQNKIRTVLQPLEPPFVTWLCFRRKETWRCRDKLRVKWHGTSTSLFSRPTPGWVVKTAAWQLHAHHEAFFHLVELPVAVCSWFFTGCITIFIIWWILINIWLNCPEICTLYISYRFLAWLRWHVYMV